MGPKNYKMFNVKGAILTAAIGINNQGRIVGFFVDAQGRHRGFVKNGMRFTKFSVPGAMETTLTGINSHNEIVGDYVDANGNQHSILRVPGGPPITIHCQGATYTAAAGINDAGWIVGHFGDAGGMQHGFLKSGATEAAAAGGIEHEEAIVERSHVDLAVADRGRRVDRARAELAEPDGIALAASAARGVEGVEVMVGGGHVYHAVGDNGARR